MADTTNTTTRDSVLAQCCACDAAWQQRPGRNLVLFFDGTGNILGDHRDTNVVKLLRRVDTAPAARQLIYYDPGVGTANEFPAVDWVTRLRNATRRLNDQAFGSGAFSNIAEGYQFIVEHYQDGDRIFLFGFSRGAFTARAVGGMVNMYGLIHSGGLPLLPTLVRTYFSEPGSVNREGKSRAEFAQEVMQLFSQQRRPLIHFVGVWDTVETIGGALLGPGVRITNSSAIVDKRFVHVRHALALHETRAKYAPRRYQAPDFTATERQHRSFDERWFRGVHSDIGGGYRRDGLSNITLDWMIGEAGAPAYGLALKALPLAVPDAQAAMHDQTLASPFWAWTGLWSRPRRPHDVVDASALPVAGATPATATPASRKAAWLGVLLVLLGAELLWRAAGISHAACQHNGQSFDLSLALLLAPFQAHFGISCSPQEVSVALQGYAWAIPVYALLLAFPVSWALRRLNARAVLSGARTGRLAAHSAGFMLALVLADVVLNISARHLLPADRWAEAAAGLAMVASGVKWGSALLLAAVAAQAGVVLRRKA